MRKLDFCICVNKCTDHLCSTAQLISAFVVATWIVQFLFSSTCVQHFKHLAFFCDCTDRFMIIILFYQTLTIQVSAWIHLSPADYIIRCCKTKKKRYHYRQFMFNDVNLNEVSVFDYIHTYNNFILFIHTIRLTLILERYTPSKCNSQVCLILISKCIFCETEKKLTKV